MASSLWEINFNYNKAVKQSNDLKGVARDLANAANRDMEDILSEVDRVWKSDNSSQYIQKGQKVCRDIVDTSKRIEQIADAIRTIAERVRRAEMEAWRIANERKT